MGKYFRTIYLYIVAFATLCMVVAGFAGAVNSFVAYAYLVINEYEVENSYYDYGTNKYLVSGDLGYILKVRELEKIEQRESLKTAFTYLAILACGAPLYVFHTKQIKKESEKEV